MNKKQIKNSLKEIKPDAHFETRLSAKVNSSQAVTHNHRFKFSTAIACSLVLVLSLSVGIGLNCSKTKSPEASLSVNYANETASVDSSKIPSEVAEELNTRTETKGNSIQVSVPAPETNVHYHQRLFVNGKDIAPDNYVKFYEIKNYAFAPLTAILEEYGATVKWTSQADAIITLNGKNYILDAEKCTLKEENGSENLLTPYFAPGTKTVKDCPLYTRYKDDFIVDNYTLQGALKELGFNYTVYVDYKTETITIR